VYSSLPFEILELMRKNGFKHTMQILSKRKDFKMTKSAFYKDLNNFSYYNSFLRVKDVLLEDEIITIRKNKSNKQEIVLTPKGVVILKKLKELNELL